MKNTVTEPQLIHWATTRFILKLEPRARKIEFGDKTLWDLMATARALETEDTGQIHALNEIWEFIARVSKWHGSDRALTRYAEAMADVYRFRRSSQTDLLVSIVHRAVKDLNIPVTTK